jgi:hypothetical protein
MVEAYGCEGAIALSKEFPLQFLDSLLCQTAELRKTPEERIEEERKKAIAEWKTKNLGRTLTFTGPDGGTKTFTVGSSLLARMQQNGFINGDTDSSESVGGDIRSIGD